jgi:hypothetical protein
MQSIYTYIPETNRVYRVHSVATILYLLFTVHVMLFPVLNLLYFYTSCLLLLLLLAAAAAVGCMKCPATSRNRNTHVYLDRRLFGLEDKTTINSRERVVNKTGVPLPSSDTSGLFLLHCF